MNLVPTENWIPHPVSDAANYLDREPPQYLEPDDPDPHPIRLRSMAERNQLMREFVETHQGDEAEHLPAGWR